MIQFLIFMITKDPFVFKLSSICLRSMEQFQKFQQDKQKNTKSRYCKFQIVFPVIPLTFSRTATTDLKGHVLSTNYTFMAETLGRPRGLHCFMLAPFCLDKAG